MKSSAVDHSNRSLTQLPHPVLAEIPEASTVFCFDLKYVKIQVSQLSKSIKWLTKIVALLSLEWARSVRLEIQLTYSGTG